MDSNLLDPNQVLPARCVLRQRERPLLLAHGWPIHLAGAEGWALLGDLEPVTAAIISMDVAGSFAHVDQNWADVVYRLSVFISETASIYA